LPNNAGQSYMFPMNMQQVGQKAEDPANPGFQQDENTNSETLSPILGPDGHRIRRTT